MITIEHMNFTCKLAILNICSECAGHSIIAVNHCHFTYSKENELVDYNYSESDDDYSNGTIYDYDDDIDDHGSLYTMDSMVLSFYNNCQNHKSLTKYTFLISILKTFLDYSTW